MGHWDLRKLTIIVENHYDVNAWFIFSHTCEIQFHCLLIITWSVKLEPKYVIEIK